MALVTHSLIAFFFLSIFSTFSLERVHTLGDKKGDKDDDSKCPPPPCPPPPPPPCPPPPPKCPLGCIPAPPPCKPCKSCDKGKDWKDDDRKKGVKDRDDQDDCKPCKDDCKDDCKNDCKHDCKHCKDDCRSCKPKSRPKSPKFPPKSSKNPPKDGDDEDDHKGDKLTDRDVRNLNNLLAVQFVLNDIFLRASLGNARARPSSVVQPASVSQKVVFQQVSGDQQMIPQMLSEFSAISIAQVSSMLSVLQDRAIQRPQDLNVTNEVLSTAVNRAFNGSLRPDFSIDDDPTKLLLGVQSLGPGLAASVATDMLPNLESSRAVSLVAGILPALASQDASMRTVLYSEREARVEPYNYTVGEFMQKTSSLTANLQQDPNGSSGNGSGGDILSVNVLGSGIAVPAENVLNLISSLLNIASIG